MAQSTIDHVGGYAPQMGPDPRVLEQRASAGDGVLVTADLIEETRIYPEDFLPIGTSAMAATTARPESYSEVTGEQPAAIPEVPQHPTGITRVTDRPTRFMGVARLQDVTGRYIGRATVQHREASSEHPGDLRFVRSHRSTGRFSGRTS